MNYHISFDLDFKRNEYKGLYIALEGLDGSGKTIQMQRLSEYFREQNKDILTIAEPRRTGLVGRVINEFLEKRVKLPPTSLQYLFSADRIAYLEEVIIPSLKKGRIVISHRCFWSAIPYGIMDRSGKKYNYEAGEALMVAQSILSMYHQIMIPDITFYLQVSAKTALDRLHKMSISKEYYETKEKLMNVQKGYEWMIKKFPKEFTVIDGEQPVEKVTKEIIKSLKLSK